MSAKQSTPMWLRDMAEYLERYNEDAPRPSLPKGHPLNKFVCVERPGVSLAAYLAHLHRHVHCDASWSVAVGLLARFCEGRSTVPLNPYTVHRVAITTLLVAHKVASDATYTNAVFAEMGLLLLEDMNDMERALLEAVEFNVNVTREELSDALHLFGSVAPNPRHTKARRVARQLAAAPPRPPRATAAAPIDYARSASSASTILSIAGSPRSDCSYSVSAASSVASSPRASPYMASPVRGLAQEY